MVTESLMASCGKAVWSLTYYQICLNIFRHNPTYYWLFLREIAKNVLNSDFLTCVFSDFAWNNNSLINQVLIIRLLDNENIIGCSPECNVSTRHTHVTYVYPKLDGIKNLFIKLRTLINPKLRLDLLLCCYYH